MVYTDELRGLSSLRDVYPPDYTSRYFPERIRRGRLITLQALSPRLNTLNGSWIDRELSTNPEALIPVEERNIETEEMSGCLSPSDLSDFSSWVLGLMDMLDVPEASVVLKGYLSELAKWVNRYGEEANRGFKFYPIPFEDLPSAYQEVFKCYSQEIGQLADFPDIDPHIASKVGEYSAKQLVDALPWAAVAGEVMNQYQLDYRLKLGFDYMDSYQFEEMTIRFKAFGTYWYPIWQFHVIRGYVIPIMKEILVEAERNDLRDIDIMAWATTRFPELEGLSPSDWIRLYREPSTVLPTISEYNPLERKSTPMRPTHPSTQRPLPIATKEAVGEDIDPSMIRDFHSINKNVPALYLLSGFLQSLLVKDTQYFSIVENLNEFGAMSATKVTSSFFQSYIFMSELVERIISEPEKFPESFAHAYNTIDWLGIQVARTQHYNTELCVDVGHTLSIDEAANIVGKDSIHLSDLEARKQLISVKVMGEQVYPAWQFDSERSRVRPIVRELLPAMESQDSYVDPITIAAWATKPDQRNLEGFTPSEWIKQIENNVVTLDNDDRKALWSAAEDLVFRTVF